MLPNTSELVLLTLAAASIGLTTVLLNPAYQLLEIEYMLKKVDCKGVVAYDSFKTLKHLDILKQICPEIEESAPGELKSSKLPSLKHIIILNDPKHEQKKRFKGTWEYERIADKQLSDKSYEKPHVEQVP